MNYVEVRDYIMQLEEEVRRLRNLRRLYRKQMREMQHVLEQKNLRQKVLMEWRIRREIESYPLDSGADLLRLHQRNRKEIES